MSVWKLVIQGIAELKQRVSYASGWAGLLGMPFLVSKDTQDILAASGWHINRFIIILALVIFAFTGAWIAEKLGIWQAENNFGLERQPMLLEELRQGRKK